MRTEPEIDFLVRGGAGVDTIVYVPELPPPFSHPVAAIETRAGQTDDFTSRSPRSRCPAAPDGR